MVAEPMWWVGRLRSLCGGLTVIIGLVSVQLALDCQLKLSLAKFHLGEGDLFRQRAASIYDFVSLSVSL